VTAKPICHQWNRRMALFPSAGKLHMLMSRKGEAHAAGPVFGPVYPAIPERYLEAILSV